jgi:hypothetical protein
MCSETQEVVVAELDDDVTEFPIPSGGRPGFIIAGPDCAL